MKLLHPASHYVSELTVLGIKFLQPPLEVLLRSKQVKVFVFELSHQLRGVLILLVELVDFGQAMVLIQLSVLHG